MIEIKSKDTLESELKAVVKAYHKGLITYAEYVLKQTELIHSALICGVPWAEVNEVNV